MKRFLMFTTLTAMMGALLAQGTAFGQTTTPTNTPSPTTSTTMTPTPTTSVPSGAPATGFGPN